MEKFEAYLHRQGIHFKIAARYAKVAVYYITWLKENKLKAEKVKRSQFTDWLHTYREQGFQQCTLDYKENVIRYYYRFLGTKNNPAMSWMERKEEYKLPPPPLEKKELRKIYQNFRAVTFVEQRNRIMLGFVLFQALKRNELEELRISDINLKKRTVFVQQQMRSNSRFLKLEPIQLVHLKEYLSKQRKQLLSNKKEYNDQVFISHGYAKNLEWALKQLIEYLKRNHPHVKNLYHLRTSRITHWRNEQGLMEAMIMAGHQHANSTRRYETKKYDELHEQLKIIHPMEKIKL